MKIYHYSRDKYEFLTEGEARENPLEKAKHLIPAFATDIEPPSLSENEVAIFNESTESWEVKADYRGENFYYKDTGKKIEIEQIGEVGNELTDITPPQTSVNERAIFNHDINEWEIKVDYVGRKYFNENGVEVEITEIGVEPDPSWFNTYEEYRIAELENALADIIGGGTSA